MVIEAGLQMEQTRYDSAVVRWRTESGV